MFKIEEAQYLQENIDFTQVVFEDNQGNIDLIEGKMGVFKLLDQECIMKETSDAKYLELLKSKLGKHPNYLEGPKMKRNVFGIAHFAGEVIYNTTGFVDKNKNSANKDTNEILEASSIPIIASILGKSIDANDDANKSKKKGLPPPKKSVSGQFVEQL
jgi:myosin VIIa